MEQRVWNVSRLATVARSLLLCSGLSLGFLQASAAVALEGKVPAHDRLEARQGEYVLGRALRDFYDTVFVLTAPGASAPRVVTIDELADTLQSYDVIFFGEIHGHPGVHLQQLKLLQALEERDPHLVLSLEQFERDVQGVVDDYLAGRIGERTLITRGRAWENYLSSYRPLVLYARDHGLPVIAAEAPGWSISCIGQYGADILGQFTPEERAWVARELHVTPGAYRDKFRQFQSANPNHGGAGASSPEAQRKSERGFTAQVARDDTMAESIFLARLKYPGRRILQLNGNFHSEGFLGTAERLRMRDPSVRIAVIDPIEVDDVHAPAFAAEQRNAGTVLQLVYPTPAEFVENEDQNDWVRSIMAKRKATVCKYALPSLDESKGAAPSPVPAAAPAPAPAGASTETSTAVSAVTSPGAPAGVAAGGVAAAAAGNR